ncbi:hypothetical protein PIB30_001207 [Stylosanthes scabra]|uniref:RRM domain-containing protein n=1 Tax=Stylosanthes scabra TaxID=79078 RepID=A0ABU6W395_9FABA|nr:hypothetical protein [Stylosanthes scabra]
MVEIDKVVVDAMAVPVKRGRKKRDREHRVRSRNDRENEGSDLQRRWNERNTFSIFADNLPADASLGWLWKVFSSVGEVVDVYLSRKRRTNNPLRFAFIRYKSRNEALRAIEQYDGWIVWGCEIKLTESRYKRNIKDHTEKKQEGAKGSANTDGNVENDGMMKQGKSYKDVVLAGSNAGNSEKVNIPNDMQTLGESKILLSRNGELLQKMKRGLVGETMSPIEFNTLKNAVLEDWANIQEVSMIGPMKMLLVFDSEEHMMEACESPNMLNHFIDVRPWSKGETNRLRRCWIEVVGLPVHGWLVDNMCKIGEVWGRVIEVVGGSENQFSSFKVLIDVGVGPMIQAFADVLIEEETFRIFVREVDICHACLKDKDAVNCYTLDANREEDRIRENAMSNMMRQNDAVVVVETMAEETEKSRVGETETVQEVGEDGIEKMSSHKCPESPVIDECGPLAPGQEDSRIGANGECPINGASQTRTRSIEDDRRTDDVIREKINAIGLVVGNKDGESGHEEEVDMVAQTQLGLNADPTNDPNWSSIPPGFEGFENERDTLQDGESDTQQNGEGVRVIAIQGGNDNGKSNRPRRKCCPKLKGILVEKARRPPKKFSLKEDEIEDDDDVIDWIWEAGYGAGLVAEDIFITKKFLEDRATELGVKTASRQSHRREEKTWNYCESTVNGNMSGMKLLKSKSVAIFQSLPFGDFNEVLHAGERSSGRINNVGVQDFKQWMMDMEVEDKFLGLQTKAIKCSKSDHIPIILCRDEEDLGPKPFRSLDVWLSHHQFKAMFKKEWRQTQGRNVAEKLKP